MIRNPFQRRDPDLYEESAPRESFFVPPVLLYFALGVALLFVLLISSVPLTLDQQLLFVLASLGLSLLLRPRSELSRYRVIVLIAISLIATGRYIYWRLTESMGWFSSNLELTYLDYFFSSGLLLAEIYAWTVLFLGYFQTIWPLRRPVYPLPSDRSKWPTVDVYVPTYNEPLKVVIPTLLAARNIDWPADKLNVYVLDDGCREEFRQFAADAGINYIARKSSEGAKAGNINHGLALTDGDFIAIFDSDHVPVRSFLSKTMGWFLRDPRMGIVQTPHVFFTPDPVERNLQVYHRVPPEGQLFYGLVQDGNDTWNASFFCGSCAVLSREALDDIGGIATATVTEDAHTSLLIQKKGWNTAYINTPLAAGLATERLADHIGQRMRWARGMIQIFRTDNPLLAKGLKLGQRLCYFNAMLHFLFGLPRIIFLTAPLAYLFFESYVIQASAALIAVYALPHIFQAQVANSVMQGRFRHSFWADVYETLISAHLIGPTLGALINPAKGRFNVTSKGGIVDEDHFDWTSSRIVFLLLLLNLIGLVIAVLRLFWLNPDETGTVMINLGWTLYNSIILGAALSVAWEKRQRRDSPRIHRTYKAMVHTADGRRIRAETSDLSLKDISLKIPPASLLKANDRVVIELFEGTTGYKFEGTAITVMSRHLGVKFDELSPHRMSDLVYFTHSRDHAWDDWYRAWRPSKPLASFLEIVRFGVIGVFRALAGHSDDPENRIRPDFKTAIWLFVFALLIAGSYLLPQPAKADTLPPQETQEIVLPLHELGIQQPIRLRGGNTQDDIWFSLRADEIAQQAELRLNFSLAQQLIRDYKTLDITLNNQPIGSIPITADTVDRRLVQVFPIDPLYVSDLNQLAFRLDPIEPQFCEKLDLRAITAEIGETSEVRLLVSPLELVNDLSLFPIPFYDQHDDSKLVLPMVMGATLRNSSDALKAAGIMASWFGAKANYRGADFPVHSNQLPEQHAIVLLTPTSSVPGLSSDGIEGPSVEIISHPRPGLEHIKLLLLKGKTPSELTIAAKSITSGQKHLSGPKVSFSNGPQLPRRKPYDAPRWINDDGKTYFSELEAPAKLVKRGISPDTIDLNFRVPPDLFSWKRDDFPVNIDFNYTDLPLKEGSSMDVSLSSTWIKSLKLDTRSELPEIQDVPPGTTRQNINLATVHDSDTSYLKNYQLAGLNTLSMYFDIQLPNQAAQTCASLYTDNMTVGIDPDSHFDLSDWQHYTRMPDLAKFANIGFPFTRLADLSETAVLMPHNPVNEEVHIMLNSLGLFGAASGYPAFGVEILYPDNAQRSPDKDILMIGSNERQPLLRQWHDTLPLETLEDGSWQLRPLSPLEEARLWWKGEKRDGLGQLRRTLNQSGDSLVAIVSFGSPLNEKKTVVAMVASDPENLQLLGTALTDSTQLPDFRGDTTLLTDTTPQSFRLLPTYYIGELPFLIWIRWYLANHIIALLLLFTGVVLSFGLILRVLLRQRAEERFDVDSIEAV